jgi:RNA polymerase sigma factor (sigma-70 family)
VKVVCSAVSSDAVDHDRIAAVPRERDRPEATGDATSTYQADIAEVAPRVWRAFEQLPLNQQVILMLREVRGLSYQEIALTMCLTTETVKSQLACGRETLRAAVLQLRLRTEVVSGDSRKAERCEPQQG